VSPNQVLGRFNGFLKSVVLRVSEARDLGEFDRFQLYDHMKANTAAPPDVLRVDEKNLREHPIVNCCGVIITTNHKTDGIYLPADDRRHFVAWSDRTKEDDRFQGNYWNDLWSYYENGGRGHVTAFLLQRDISKFNPKAPPPHTPAFWAIVDANRAPEESEMADALDKLGNPNAVTLAQIQNACTDSFADWLGDRKNRRIIPHRLEQCRYVPVRNPDADDGLWKIGGRRKAVYAKATIPLRDQIAAAQMLTGSTHANSSFGIFPHRRNQSAPVTQVISRFKDSGALIHWAWKCGRDGLDYRAVRDKAADAGTMAHDAIEAHIRGHEFAFDSDPEICARARCAFGAFLEWAEQTQMRVTHTELALVSERHRFGGTMDAIVLRIGRAVGEWKASNGCYPEYLIQVAAYGQLWNENFPNAPITSRLPPPPLSTNASATSTPVGGANSIKSGRHSGICERCGMSTSNCGSGCHERHYLASAAVTS
jgi:hypothetical protein